MRQATTESSTISALPCLFEHRLTRPVVMALPTLSWSRSLGANLGAPLAPPPLPPPPPAAASSSPSLEVSESESESESESDASPAPFWPSWCAVSHVRSRKIRLKHGGSEPGLPATMPVSPSARVSAGSMSVSSAIRPPGTTLGSSVLPLMILTILVTIGLKLTTLPFSSRVTRPGRSSTVSPRRSEPSSRAPPRTPPLSERVASPG
mmetsp:Transcript_12357/g.33466  ORF Transcript_12357/g.33466 Transcript_12357/m.33466 type:complete len:207 (-) Transcript_12357:2789-3409(-)